MSKIKRYEMGFDCGGEYEHCQMRKCVDGDYMLFEDHQRAIADERARCRQEEVTPLTRTCNLLVDYIEDAPLCFCEPERGIKCRQCSEISQAIRTFLAIEKIQKEKP